MSDVVSSLVNMQWGIKGIGELINIHPVFVHFPIALLLASTAFYFLGSIVRREELLAAGKWVLYLGTISAALTVWTGLRAEATVSHGAGVHEVMVAHQYIGYAVLGLSLILSVWVLASSANAPSKGRVFFLVGLILLCTILIQGADLGGRMAFLNGVGVGKKSMVQEMQAHPHAGHEHGAHEHGEHDHE